MKMKTILSVMCLVGCLGLLSGCATTRDDDKNIPDLPVQRAAPSGGSDAALSAAKMF
jgi:hypothetical protein